MREDLARSLPDEYLAVLRDLAGEPQSANDIRDIIADIDDADLTAAVLPMPTRWAADDYALFYADQRVFGAEVRRRVETAVDEWIESGRWSWRAGGLDDDDYRRIVAEVRGQFDAEMKMWGPGIARNG